VLKRAAKRHGYDLRALIFDLLAHDPRPAYRREETQKRSYGMQIEDLDIKWRVVDEKIVVTAITQIHPPPNAVGSSVKNSASEGR
jgi:hypothetical protein